MIGVEGHSPLWAGDPRMFVRQAKDQGSERHSSMVSASGPDLTFPSGLSVIFTCQMK